MTESMRAASTENNSVPQSTGVPVGALARHRTRLVPVEWGGKVLSIGGQAPVLVQSIEEALSRLKQDGFTLLIAEQNQILQSLADRVLNLTSGVLSS